MIVTDNHPMIVSDDVNDTVEAIDSLDKPQYSCDWDDDTVGAHIRDSACVAIGDNYNLYTIVRRGNYHHISAPNIKFDEDLGYFLGFFVAEGWFAAMPNHHSYGMMIKVKGTEDLHKCCDALFRSTGIVAFIQEHEDWRGCRTLKVSHPDFVDYCMNKMSSPSRTAYTLGLLPALVSIPLLISRS